MAVAVEDAKFYQNHGIDIKGIIRSVIYDIKKEIKPTADQQSPSSLSDQHF